MAKRKIKPGTWRDVNEMSQEEIKEEARRILASAKPSKFHIPTQEEAYAGAVPYVSDSLVAQYKFFQDKIFRPKSVFYPCCNLDISPTKAFPDSNVTLLDREFYAVEAIKRAGVDALCMDIRDYHPEEPHDLLILLNPQIATSDAMHTLKSDAYIIANNYHGNSTQMFESPGEFRFIGLMDNKVKKHGVWEDGEVKIVASENEARKMLKRHVDFFSIFRRKQ